MGSISPPTRGVCYPGDAAEFCFKTIVGALLLFAISACSDSSNNKKLAQPVTVEPTTTYDAEIIWTEYGIPHITAQDWGSLGYGYGYAYASENFCLVMKEVIRANSESARYLGLEGDIDADLVYKAILTDDNIASSAALLSDDETALNMGYVAGMNRYLAETGVANLPAGEEGCREADWVRELTIDDLRHLQSKLALIGSTTPLVPFTIAAAPTEQVTRALPAVQKEEMIAALAQLDLTGALGMPTPDQMGSNAYGIGGDATQSGSGMVLGNPHFDWTGYLRLFISHMTVADEYDVMGASVGGFPWVNIGFNQDFAWSLTTSTAQRFTFYELTLNPDNPMQYEYDGQFRDIEAHTVSAQVLGENGAIETREHTVYFSHYGPILDLASLSPLLAGWPNPLGTVFTYRDANVAGTRGLEEGVAIGQARSIDDLKRALSLVSNPFNNTIAADREGNAFYGDFSVTPNVTSAQFNNCIRGVAQTLLTDGGFTTLDGSDSACEWGTDEGTRPGILGAEQRPILETRDYVANSNDSYWFSNPRQLLEGYSPILGGERELTSGRTKQAFRQAEERLAGTDGRGEPGFNIDNLREIMFAGDDYFANLMVDALVAACSGVEDWSPYSANPESAAQACTVLGDWDRTSNLDSVGWHVFVEWAKDCCPGASTPWFLDDWDPALPLSSPNMVNPNEEWTEIYRNMHGVVVDRLTDAGIAMDAKVRDIQYVEKAGKRIPIHGGIGGSFSIIGSPLVDGEGYSAIDFGNSYIQAVTWDESDCPVAYALLSYSQSTNPESPHYADGTQAYSDQNWIDMPFCETDRDAAETRRETISE